MRVLAGDGDRPADVLLAVAAQILSGEGDAPPLGIDEAQQEPDDRRLPGAASSEQHDSRARIEPEAEVVQRGPFVRPVPRSHVFEHDGER